MSVFRLFLLIVFIVGLAGTASAQGLTITSSPSTITLKTQQAATIQVTITPMADTSGSVSLSCATTALYVTCNWPNQVQIFPFTGGSPVTFPLIVNTSNINMYDPQAKLRTGNGTIAFAGLALPAALMLAFARRRRLSAPMKVMLAAAILFPMAALTGCGNTYPVSTPPGSYTLNLVSGATTFLSIPLIVTN